MKRYIERDLAEKAMMDLEDNDIELYGGVSIPEGFDGKRAVEALRGLPTDDVEEVVRCKNCKFRFSETCFSKHETADMDFCSCGMKANGGSNNET